MNQKTSSLFLLISLIFFQGCGNRGDDGEGASSSANQVSSPPTSADVVSGPAPYVGMKQTTATGIKYEVLRVGTGVRPKAWDRVKVHYHGYLPNGTVFDSSVQRGTPIVFGLNQVIPGWTEGVQLMQEGAKYRFYIPWLQAYGLEGSPPKIGPKQDLMFDIELFEVVR